MQRRCARSRPRWAALSNGSRRSPPRRSHRWRKMRGSRRVELTRQLDERGTRFTAQPAGVAALGSFMHETGLSRAEPGKLDELRFHL